jgi:hypothetical protein
MRSASHNRDRCTRMHVLQRSIAAECDKNDFSAIGSRSIQWLRVNGGVDASE